MPAPGEAGASDFAGAAWMVGPADGPALAAAERLVGVVGVTGPQRVARWAAHREGIGAAHLRRVRSALEHRRAIAG